jgi:DNA-directed RNA polymerase specialized sigma24 family protein
VPAKLRVWLISTGKFKAIDLLRRQGRLKEIRPEIASRLDEVADENAAPETEETLGGILLLEARDLNQAISLMSKHPGVKMGPFEIRPANEAINDLIALRDAAVAKNA